MVDIVDAAPTPRVSMDPGGTRMAVAHYPALPSMALLAAPMHRLAGVRIDPRAHARRTTRLYDRIEVRATDGGAAVEVKLPAGGGLSAPTWSPDGRHLAFTRRGETGGLELWVADARTGEARRLTERSINGVMGGLRWMPGSDAILANLVPAGLGPAPKASPVPAGPAVQETAGRKATNRTYQDLLKNAHDDALFEHFARSELALVGLDGKTRVLPGVDMYSAVSPAPDGRHVRVERVNRPFSRSVPLRRFPRTVEVWDLQGGAPVTIADLPAAEEVPIGGVPTGPRALRWQPGEAATLVWVEALDGGDPNTEAPARDRLMRRAMDEGGDAVEFARIEHRFRDLQWLEGSQRYLVTDYDRDRRWTRTELRDLAQPDARRVLFDRSIHDRYGDPGEPVMRRGKDGTWAVRVDDDAIFLSGMGASKAGDRPFLDRLPLQEGAKATRLFHSPPGSYARFVDFAGDSTDALVLWQESPTAPPNYFVSTLGPEATTRAVTDFPHPHPQISGIEKQLLTYTRADGVPLSGTLYLPADRAEGERLPLLVWAYPREYTDPKTAGQVRAAPTRFTRLRGTSPLLFLTQGYAVLDGAAMPVVGDPKNMNDTLIPQLVDAAAAAIDAAAKTGAVDSERVAVAGHSYGAFMTANLLAHSDLFRAGIARSGAYNRTLTPFGFQSERRTLWEAPAAYEQVSPLFHADKINEPLLMIHGEVDNNSGTFPLQSRRLFHAMKGLGGTARLVMLPNESHGYRGRASVLHVLAESLGWLDRHVKGAGSEAQEGTARAPAVTQKGGGAPAKAPG